LQPLPTPRATTQAQDDYERRLKKEMDEKQAREAEIERLVRPACTARGLHGGCSPISQPACHMRVKWKWVVGHWPACLSSSHPTLSCTHPDAGGGGDAAH